MDPHKTSDILQQWGKDPFAKTVLLLQGKQNKTRGSALIEIVFLIGGGILLFFGGLYLWNSRDLIFLLHLLSGLFIIAGPIMVIVGLSYSTLRQ